MTSVYLEPTLLEFDLDLSTVTIAGEHRYPAVNPICPCDEDCGDHPVTDHALWRHPSDRIPPSGIQPDFDAYIPTEAGFLVQVVEHIHPSAGPRPHLELRLDAMTCTRTPWDDGWIPYGLEFWRGRIRGTMRLGTSGKFYWDEAEPEWIAEFIGWVTRLPYDEPPGPAMTLVRLGHTWDDA